MTGMCDDAGQARRAARDPLRLGGRLLRRRAGRRRRRRRRCTSARRAAKASTSASRCCARRSRCSRRAWSGPRASRATWAATCARAASPACIRRARGYLYISANTPHFWHALCEKTGLTGAADDARYDIGAQARASIGDEIVPRLRAGAGRAHARSSGRRSSARRCRAPPRARVEDMFDHPQVRGRGRWSSAFEHPTLGSYRGFTRPVVRPHAGPRAVRRADARAAHRRGARARSATIPAGRLMERPRPNSSAPAASAAPALRLRRAHARLRPPLRLPARPRWSTARPPPTTAAAADVSAPSARSSCSRASTAPTTRHAGCDPRARPRAHPRRRVVRPDVTTPSSPSARRRRSRHPVHALHGHACRDRFLDGRAARASRACARLACAAALERRPDRRHADLLADCRHAGLRPPGAPSLPDPQAHASFGVVSRCSTPAAPGSSCPGRT